MRSPLPLRRVLTIAALHLTVLVISGAWSMGTAFDMSHAGQPQSPLIAAITFALLAIALVLSVPLVWIALSFDNNMFLLALAIPLNSLLWGIVLVQLATYRNNRNGQSNQPLHPDALTRAGERRR